VAGVLERNQLELHHLNQIPHNSLTSNHWAQKVDLEAEKRNLEQLDIRLKISIDSFTKLAIRPIEQSILYLVSLIIHGIRACVLLLVPFLFSQHCGSLDEPD
jgi:hypothetical protein